MSSHDRGTGFRFLLFPKELLWAECLCPPKIHMLKPPQSDGVWRRGLWEVTRFRGSREKGASMMRLVCTTIQCT